MFWENILNLNDLGLYLFAGDFDHDLNGHIRVKVVFKNEYPQLERMENFMPEYDLDGLINDKFIFQIRTPIFRRGLERSKRFHGQM